VTKNVKGEGKEKEKNVTKCEGKRKKCKRKCEREAKKKTLDSLSKAY